MWYFAFYDTCQNQTCLRFKKLSVQKRSVPYYSFQIKRQREALGWKHSISRVFCSKLERFALSVDMQCAPMLSRSTHVR